jgi:hypothetical protein
MSESLTSLIHTYECDDPSDTAKAVMDFVKMSKRHRELFFALLRDECRRLSRSATRIAERANATDRFVHDTQTADVGGDIEAMSRPEWLRRRIYCGPLFGYVITGSATVEQWRARIDFLASYRNGITQTISVAESLIAQIEAARVECLFDLEAPRLGDPA